MCLNQAIGKLQKELLALVSTRDQIIEIMEEYIESEKLENLLNQMKQVPVLSGSNLNNLTLKSGYQRGFSGF